eukprot:72984-Chlamydomonas_euryale.AAC.8
MEPSEMSSAISYMTRLSTCAPHKNGIRLDDHFRAVMHASRTEAGRPVQPPVWLKWRRAFVCMAGRGCKTLLQAQRFPRTSAWS